MMEYKIVTAENYRNLEERVRESISDGWIPQGGVSVSMSFGTSVYSSRYVQAMVRTK